MGLKNPERAKEKAAVNKFNSAGNNKMRMIQASRQLEGEKNALINYVLQKRFSKKSDRRFNKPDTVSSVKLVMRIT